MDQDALNSLKIDRDAAQAESRARLRPLWMGVAVGLFLLAVALSFWFLGSQAVVVETTAARAEHSSSNSSTTVLNASGYVVPRRMATVSSKITGQVVEVYVEEGMAVEQGQVLARLEDDIAQARLDLAKSRLETTKRSKEEIQVRLAQARRDLSRTRSLQEENLVSRSALDTAASEVAALDARLAVAGSEVVTAQRNMALSEQQLQETVVRAPFAGVVTVKNAQPGEIVSPISAGGGFTRTGIATIVDMASLEIEVDVNESYIKRVFEGQSVEAILDAYPEIRFPGHVIGIVPTANRQSATVKVRIGFDQLDARILPEMGVQVWFLEERPERVAQSKGEQTVWVAASALRQGEGQDFVFVVQDGRAQRRAVQVKRERGGEVAIGAGLNGGERVVVESKQELKDGMAVTEEET